MILDTNAVSALAEGNSKITEVVDQAQVVSVPVVVLGEYYFGISQSRHRAKYESWLDDLLAIVEICEITHSTAIHYAAIRAELKKAGRPIPENDLWIAAICRENNRPLVSRDKDFDAVKDLRRLDW